MPCSSPRAPSRLQASPSTASPRESAQPGLPRRAVVAATARTRLPAKPTLSHSRSPPVCQSAGRGQALPWLGQGRAAAQGGQLGRGRASRDGEGPGRGKGGPGGGLGQVRSGVAPLWGGGLAAEGPPPRAARAPHRSRYLFRAGTGRSHRRHRRHLRLRRRHLAAPLPRVALARLRRAFSRPAPSRNPLAGARDRPPPRARRVPLP